MQFWIDQIIYIARRYISLKNHFQSEMKLIIRTLVNYFKLLWMSFNSFSIANHKRSMEDFSKWVIEFWICFWWENPENTIHTDSMIAPTEQWFFLLNVPKTIYVQILFSTGTKRMAYILINQEYISSFLPWINLPHFSKT